MRLYLVCSQEGVRAAANPVFSTLKNTASPISSLLLIASPDAHDGLPCRVELARNLRNRHAFGQQPAHVAFLRIRQRRWPTKLLAFGLCTLQAAVRALDEQVAFKFRYRIDYLHC